MKKEHSAAEFGESSGMALIMISSFSLISVKDNELLKPVLGSWIKNETGSVIISWGLEW